jgi:hypothetical protein
MNDIQRSILFLTSALAVLLVALILRSTGKQVDKVRPIEAKFAFNAESACEAAKTLAADFPDRGTGTEGSRAAADWIESQMKGMRLDTEQQEFEVWIAGERVVGQNVIGTLKGVRRETIVVIAHYDIPYHVREGAVDDASGVGVLLELARVFSRERQNQKKTLVFIASDAEEWGMLGARHYAQTHPEPERIRAAISLDLVRPEDDGRVSISGQGQVRGQVPAWLWMLVEDCIVRTGGVPVSDDTFEQFLSQAVNISSTDQGPFLKEGIAAANLGGNLSTSPLGREIYHTVRDTSENLKPEYFDVYGKSAELTIRSLSALDRSTVNDPYYLRTGMHTYVGRSSLRAMQLIIFFPLLLVTCFLYYNLRTRKNPTREILVEVANLLLFMAPWALALVALRLLVRGNVIPRYELYPATPLDPFLYAPVWSGVVVVALAATAGWVAVRFARRTLSLSDKTDFECSRAVCLDMLFTVAIVTLLLKNGFAACFFLAPAALLWNWIDGGRKPGRVLANLALLIAGTLPLALLTITLARDLMLGPYVLWYLVLGAGYGLFSPLTVMLAVGTATVGVRLLQQSLSPVEAAVEQSTAEHVEDRFE